jgi:DNA-3-methyladenine glycosylase II
MLMDQVPSESAALAHLRARDPRFHPWVERLGPLALPRVEQVDLYAALCRAVIGQQLSGKAATAIVARVRAALGGEFTPARVRRVPAEVLRAAGLSGQKAATLKALAEHTRTAHWPRPTELEALSDAELIERLTAVRGVGASARV